MRIYISLCVCRFRRPRFSRKRKKTIWLNSMANKDLIWVGHVFVWSGFFSHRVANTALQFYCHNVGCIVVYRVLHANCRRIALPLTLLAETRAIGLFASPHCQFIQLRSAIEHYTDVKLIPWMCQDPVANWVTVADLLHSKDFLPNLKVEVRGLSVPPKAVFTISLAHSCPTLAATGVTEGVQQTSGSLAQWIAFYYGEWSR